MIDSYASMSTQKFETKVSYPFWLIAGWACSAVWLIAMMQPAAGWRDAPEFVVSAWVLGIAHPAGFPLYQSVVWFLEQLPMGDVLLRNHTCSVVFTIIAGILLYHLTLSFMKLVSPQEQARTYNKIFAGWVSLCWLFMPAQINNAIQSEVYSFHAILTFIVCILLFDFLRTKEIRRYILAVFIAGIGVGNHATLGIMLFAFIIALGILPTSISYLKTAGAGIIAGIYGLFIYAFLPVRSFNNPSYDWGNAETISRFWHHVSDKKDESNRFDAASSLLSQNNTDPFFDHLLALYDVLGFFGLLLPLAGWVWLIFKYPRSTLVCTSWAIAIFLFFLGWVSNTVLTAVLGILLLGMIPVWQFLSVYFSSASIKKRYLSILVSSFVGGIVFLQIFQTGTVFLANRADFLPKEMIEHELLHLPYRATILTALHFFHLRNLADIEGLRPDITIVGLGNIISPNDFSPLTYQDIPLLQYPTIIEIPKEGLPESYSSGEFLSELFHTNLDKTTFYLELLEKHTLYFKDYIQPTNSFWAKLDFAPKKKNMGNNYCAQFSDNISYMLNSSLNASDGMYDPQANDPQASSILGRAYLAWSTIAREGYISCPGLSRDMLLWWISWMDTSELNMPAMYNTLGRAFIYSGSLRGGKISFQISHDMGNLDASLNLAKWHELHGSIEESKILYREAFLTFGEAKAFHNYQRLMHQNHPVEKQ